MTRAGVLLALIVALAGSACDDTRPARSSAQPAMLVDLNHATTAELRALPEIGDVHAEKIIRGRPYDNKRQLVSRGIVSEAVYDKIAPRIIARQSP